MDYRDYNYGEYSSGDCDHTESEFRTVLRNGEELLWCREYNDSGGGSILDEKVWSVIIILVIVVSMLLTMKMTPAMWVLVGLLVLSFVPYLRKKPKYSSYAITDRRLILNDNGTFVFKELRDIKHVGYKEMKNGVGTIGCSRSREVGMSVSGRAYGRINSRHSTNTGVFTIYGVENPAEVCRILQDAISRIN